MNETNAKTALALDIFCGQNKVMPQPQLITTLFSSNLLTLLIKSIEISQTFANNPLLTTQTNCYRLFPFVNINLLACELFNRADRMSHFSKFSVFFSINRFHYTIYFQVKIISFQSLNFTLQQDKWKRQRTQHAECTYTTIHTHSKRKQKFQR